MTMMRSLFLSMAVLTGLIYAAIHAEADAGQAVGVHTEYAGDLPNVPGKRLTAIVVTYPPMTKSRPHHHDAFVFVRVLSGTIKSQVAGQRLHIFHTGDHWVEQPGAHHIVCENPSVSQTARILVVLVADERAALDQPDGSTSKAQGPH